MISQIPKFILLAITYIFIAANAYALDIKISPKQKKQAFEQLDKTLGKREYYIKLRDFRLDSIKSEFALNGDPNLLIELGDIYSTFAIDSALNYYDMANEAANDDDEKFISHVKRLPLLPLTGIFDAAIEGYEAIDTTNFSPELMAVYHHSGRNLYNFIRNSFYDRQTSTDFTAKTIESQSRLLNYLDKDSDEYQFNLGEYYYMIGNNSRAGALYSDLIAHTDDDNILWKSQYHLAKIAKALDDENAYLYYLANAARINSMVGNLEVRPLQELGTALYERNDMNRAHDYLAIALDNAISCGTTIRTLDTSKSLPLIVHSHIEQMEHWQNVIAIVHILLITLLIALGITLFLLFRRIKRMHAMQRKLRTVNDNRFDTIKRFFKLSSVYMDKLNQLCKMTERKITAGKTDELLRTVKSGKYIEDNSAEFYNAMDEAFLYVYPTFIAELNKLLLPDQQFDIKPGEPLPVGIRILAINHLGITDAASVAQILNYSVNTIYNYRNRLKMRAINRDTFDQDIMNINIEE